MNYLSTKSKTQIKVLVVDDVNENMQILGNMLSSEGYDINFASNGTYAISITEELLPHIILLDINMPDIDGYEVCKILKSNRKTRDIPIIFLTANTDEESLMNGFALGAADFVTKPFNSNELLARVKVHAEFRISKLQIEEQNKQLRQYQTAFQTINQPLFFTDVKGKISDFNQAFLDFYGYTREEIINQSTTILNAGKKTYLNLGYSEEYYNSLFRTLWEKIKDTNIGRWEGDVINKKKDGTLVWVNLLINAVMNQKDGVMSFIALPIDQTKNIEHDKNTKIELYQTISKLAELRDNETGNHMKRVGIFSKLIAKKLGMNSRFCEDMEIFSPMHDIGKVGITDQILLANRKLTVEEFNEMKKHTLLGYNIVKANREMAFVADITLYHHEKWDGSGYPNGLKGEEIPLSARITAISDVYDALRSKRPYKDEWPHQKALETIVEGAGTHFDPKLIEIFRIIAVEFEEIYRLLKD